MSATLETRLSAAGRWRRIQAPTVLAVGVLAASVALHVRDPHQSGSWGFCPWLMLTGTNCPGCGGLRAVNDLTRGDLGAAASSNLLLVGAIPLVGFFWLRWFIDGWQGVRRRLSSRRALVYAGAFLAIAFAFAVVRNTAWGAWLAP